ncbi:MAG: hypothetical protein M1830_008304 [Pleopsidium flavum]|nr:MAG: hypothetical protein M1830_008304 [Pleopsidium flavum]
MYDETITQLAPLLPQINLMRVDMNRHGKTTEGRKTFTLWEQADDLVALLNSLKIEKALLIGISMGSCIALRIALKHPARVLALVLMAATSTAATAADKQAFEYVRQPGAVPSTSNPPSFQRIKTEWVARQSGAENVDAIFETIVERDDITDMLASIRHPVLLIHGRLDRTWKMEEAVIIRDALINAKVRLEALEDCGHRVIYARDSEGVGMLIRDFIAQVMANK